MNTLNTFTKVIFCTLLFISTSASAERHLADGHDSDSVLPRHTNIISTTNNTLLFYTLGILMCTRISKTGTRSIGASITTNTNIVDTTTNMAQIIIYLGIQVITTQGNSLIIR